MRVILEREAFTFNVTRFGAARIGHVPASSDAIDAARAQDRRIAWPTVGMIRPASRGERR